jgi:hypothetical protein
MHDEHGLLVTLPSKKARVGWVRGCLVPFIISVALIAIIISSIDLHCGVNLPGNYTIVVVCRAGRAP